MFTQSHLEDSNSIRVGQPLHENAPLAPGEVSPLDAVAVGFGPVQPVVVSCDPIRPADALGHDARHIGSIHVAPVNAGRSVSPVSPEHQTAAHKQFELLNSNVSHSLD